MASRAALLKRNPLVIASRQFLTDNAVNPDRVDIDSLRAQAFGDKSVQVRAEVMLTMPADDFWQAIRDAQEQIAAEAAEEARLADQEAHEVAVAEQGEAAFQATEAEAEQIAALGKQLGVESSETFAATVAEFDGHTTADDGDEGF
ncbi:MAG: hypothetical protein K0S70_86 [Microbacterium sp.]|jgi:hypothetical protein|nr:hypothetical protein [Microbacterium sp.]